jgi:type I restriction enzyme S subunit
VGFVPNERTDAIFIHYWFSFFQKILEAQAPQVAQKNINLRILSGLKVVEPPLALQREFAAFVAKVDKLAFAVRRRRDVARQMYRAKIQEFFG